MNYTLAAAIRAEIVPYDPFGGPAYGKREMPFAAIGAAFATVGTAVTAGVAAAGGAMAVAGATLTVVATVATVAGLALTVVGAATGDQELMKIGGIVGIAGAVVGVATTVVSAATTAATTATTGATTAAGTANGITTTGGAAGAAFNSASSSATQAATQAAANSSGLIGNVGQNAATGAFNAATNAGGGVIGAAANSAAQMSSSLASAGANGGASSITTAADGTVKAVQGVGEGATDVAKQSTSFFDQLVEPKTLLEIGKVGAGMIQGDYQSEQNDKLYDLKKDQYDYQKMAAERAYANGNTQGRLNLSARELTPEEIAQASQKRAEAAKRQAQILTQPAG